MGPPCHPWANGPLVMKDMCAHNRGTGSYRRARVLLCVTIVCGCLSFCDSDAADPLGPNALAVSPDGRILYVANADAKQLAWVDIDHSAVVHTIELPSHPTGLTLSHDNQRLYVTCAGLRSLVVVVDTATRKPLATIAVGNTATAPVLAPTQRRLYVSNRFNHDVSVVDLDRQAEIARVPVTREPVAAAITRDGRMLVVANHLPLAPANGILVRAAVTLVDTASLRTITVLLPDGSSSLRGVAISPDDRYAVVTYIQSNFELVASHLDEGWMNTNAISVIDLKEEKLAGNVLLDDQHLGAPNPWGVAFSPDGSSIYVAHAGSHELSVIPTELVYRELGMGFEFRGPMGGSNALTDSRRRIALPGNGPRALAVHGTRVFVAEYFSDTIAVVDVASKSDRPPRTIHLGPTLRPSPKRLGEMLFHDARLCFQQWQSCTSCHPDGRADGLNWDLLNDGAGNVKNTKSLLLAHATPPSMVLGVRESGEAAVRSGITHILFGRPDEEAATAMDVYLKSLQAVPSPHLVNGHLSPGAKRGKRLFESARVGCTRCHPAPLYTDMKRHNIGTPDTHGNRNFDTPTLIEVWRTSPYLHDGRYTTVRGLLAEGRHGLEGATFEGLDERDIDDLVEFVLSL